MSWALQAHPAGVREHRGAVGLDVLVESLVGDGSFLYNPIVQAP
jgi:hypothetical protein